MEVTEETILKPINFHTKAAPNSDVHISGSFDKWNDELNKMTDISGKGDYYITLMLPIGRHEYKFTINGVWRVDPECDRWVVNEFGTLNNVIQVE